MSAKTHGFYVVFARVQVSGFSSCTPCVSVHGCLRLPYFFVKCRLFTTRRDVLKLGSLALGLGSSYFTLTHLKVGLGLMCPTYSLQHDQRVGKPRGSKR